MPLFHVGFVIFPDLTQLDFTGPQQVLPRLPESTMHIVAKSTASVPSDSGLGLVPTHTFENCPRLDLICVPGGNAGVVQAIGDQETIRDVRQPVVYCDPCHGIPPTPVGTSEDFFIGQSQAGATRSTCFRSILPSERCG